MALPKVLFNIEKEGLEGLVSVGDKIPGLICTGETIVGKVELGKSYQIFSLKEAEDLGISESENTFAYRQVKSFYQLAGNGAVLWVMLVSDAITMTDMLDKEGDYAPQLINDAKGEIRLLGVLKEPTGNESITNGLDEDVQYAVIEGQQLAEYFEEKYMPFRVVVSGNNWNGKIADLKDYTEDHLNKVSCLIGAENTNQYSAIGLLLGRASAIPVQRKIHRVKDGNVLPIEAYFTDGTTIESKADQWDAIDDKGYIFFRTFVGRSGYYFSGDKTLTKPTDDFKTLSNGFVMDKALLIAYDVLVSELSDEVELSVDGNIHPAIIKSWQTKVERNLTKSMVKNGELSAVSVFIEPNQNVLQTGKVVVNIRLLPVGYAEMIEVNIGFTTKIES